MMYDYVINFRRYFFQPARHREYSADETAARCFRNARDELRAGAHPRADAQRHGDRGSDRLEHRHQPHGLRYERATLTNSRLPDVYHLTGTSPGTFTIPLIHNGTKH